MNEPTLIDKATVLVVDDTPDNLSLMSGLLKGDDKTPSSRSRRNAAPWPVVLLIPQQN